MRSRCQKFVSLMLNFARVRPLAAHTILYAAMIEQDPTSREWLLIVRAMRQVEQQGMEVECHGK